MRVIYEPDGVPPSSQRAFAKFTEAGVYTTTVTQPAAFRAYLLEQLGPLVAEFGATLEVGVGAQEIPYPYVFETGDELGRGGASASELARFFPVPLLAVVGDEIADGAFDVKRRRRGRWRCSTRCASIIPCGGWSITPARTGAPCSPGCC